MKHMKKKLFQAAPVLVVAVLLVFWEAVVQIAQIPLYVLPAPSDMLKTFVTEFPVLAGHAGITVMEAFVGMGISFVVGVLIGILMDALPLVRRCIYPILVVTQTDVYKRQVQTSRKKFEQKVRAYKNWIYDNRNRPMREIIKELNVKLIGHYRYYGVTWNFRKITTFLHRVQQFLFKAMNRRGCRRAYTWNGFVEMLKYYPLAKPKTYYCLY